MAQGVKKTVLEKQLQTYGGFQHNIRQMSKDDQDRYSPEGTPGWNRWQARIKEQAARRAYRAKAVAEFEAQVPQYGSFKGFSPEEAAAILAERSATGSHWAKQRIIFKAELDKNYPAIVL